MKGKTVKRWETWVHYERGRKTIKSKLLRTNRFHWWARSLNQGLENDPAVLRAVLKTAGQDGYLTWPRVELKQSS